MAYRWQYKGQRMGPPGPERSRLPADSNEYPAYFIAAGLAVFVLFMAAQGLVFEHDQPRLPPAIAFGGATLVSVLPLLLVWKTIVFIREGRVLDFGDGRLVISRQWLFGRPIEIPYDQVTAIEAPKNRRVLYFEQGGSVRLSVYTAAGSWMMAALRLRIGCARALKSDHEDALEHFESADYHFYPSLAARKAELYEALDDLDEALECHMTGVLEHEAAFGHDSPQATFLRERLDAFTRAHPHAESARSFADIQTRSQERRDTYSAYAPPRMRDSWAPVGA